MQQTAQPGSCFYSKPPASPPAKSKRGERPTDTELHSRWLPDGRFELTLGKCVPVIVRSATFFAKTQSELYCLTGLLTLIVGYLNKEAGCNLPEKTGTFTETPGGEFVLADPADTEGARRYDKLRVPRAIAFQEHS